MTEGGHTLRRGRMTHHFSRFAGGQQTSILPRALFGTERSLDSSAHTHTFHFSSPPTKTTMSDIIVPYIAVVIVFLALGIIAQTVILLRLAPTGSIRTFFSSFKFHYPRIVAFRYRAILHPRHGLINRRVLIIGAHEIGFNHYSVHRPYPIGSRIWIYLARLNRDIPAIVISFNKSSQSYLVEPIYLPI